MAALQIEKTRPFSQPVGDIRYTQGKTMEDERGGSDILRPALEHKRFDTKIDSEGFESALVKKLGEFVIGCMNARCNGIIYFGVKDKKHSNEPQKSAQIVGLDWSKEECGRVDVMIAKNFTDHDAKQFGGHDFSTRKEQVSVVRKCLSTYFVPVECLDEKQRFVMEVEVDARATLKTHRSIIFSLKPLVGQQIVKVRRGSKSCTAQISQRFEKQVHLNTGERRKQETDASLKEAQTANEKLKLLFNDVLPDLMAGRAMTKKLMLMVGLANSDKLQETKSQVAWFQNLTWKVIFDFCQDDLQPALPSRLETATRNSSRSLSKPCYLGDVLANVSQDLPLLRCDDGSRLGKWKRSFQLNIEATLEAILTHRSEREEFKMVVVLASTFPPAKIAKVIDDALKFLLPQQIVILCDDDSVRLNLMSEVPSLFDEFKLEMVKLTRWSHLDHFFKKGDSSKAVKIPSSSGIGVPLPGELQKDLRRLDIEVVDMIDDRSSRMEAQLTREEQTHLQERNSRVRRLLKEAVAVQEEELLAFSGNLSSRVLGQGLLQGLRFECRCAVANKGLSDVVGVATQLDKLRKAEEIQTVWQGCLSYAPCKPVVLLIHGADKAKVSQLKDSLFGIVEGDEVNVRHVLFFILYDVGEAAAGTKERLPGDVLHAIVQEDSRFASLQASEGQLACQMNESIPGSQSLNAAISHDANDRRALPGDMARTTATLADHVPDGQQLFRDLTFYPAQRQLLVALAVLKRFGNLDLPSKVCRSIVLAEPGLLDDTGLFDFLHEPEVFRDYLRPEVGNELVVQEADELDHPFTAFSMRDSSVATEVLDSTCTEKTLQEVTKECLLVIIDHSSFLPRPLQRQADLSLQKLLCRRVELDGAEQVCSPLIQVLWQHDINAAMDVLKVGYENLGPESKGFVAESLARICLEEENLLLGVLQWTRDALRYLPRTMDTQYPMWMSYLSTLRKCLTHGKSEAGSSEKSDFSKLLISSLVAGGHVHRFLDIARSIATQSKGDDISIGVPEERVHHWIAVSIDFFECLKLLHDIGVADFKGNAAGQALLDVMWDDGVEGVLVGFPSTSSKNEDIATHLLTYCQDFHDKIIKSLDMIANPESRKASSMRVKAIFKSIQSCHRERTTDTRNKFTIQQIMDTSTKVLPRSPTAFSGSLTTSTSHPRTKPGRRRSLSQVGVSKDEVRAKMPCQGRLCDSNKIVDKKRCHREKAGRQNPESKTSSARDEASFKDIKSCHRERRDHQGKPTILGITPPALAEPLTTTDLRPRSTSGRSRSSPTGVSTDGIKAKRTCRTTNNNVYKNTLRRSRRQKQRLQEARKVGGNDCPTGKSRTVSKKKC